MGNCNKRQSCKARTKKGTVFLCLCLVVFFNPFVENLMDLSSWSIWLHFCNDYFNDYLIGIDTEE